LAAAFVGVFGADGFTGDLGGGGAFGEGGAAGFGLALWGAILRSCCFLKSSTSGMCGRTPPWLIVTPFSSYVSVGGGTGEQDM